MHTAVVRFEPEIFEVRRDPELETFEIGGLETELVHYNLKTPLKLFLINLPLLSSVTNCCCDHYLPTLSTTSHNISCVPFC